MHLQNSVKFGTSPKLVLFINVSKTKKNRKKNQITFEEDWDELKVAYCLNRQSQEHLIGQSKVIKQQCKGSKSFDICFFIMFRYFDQSLKSRRETTE